jgi:nicotinate phosphoribosyltransferase
MTKLALFEFSVRKLPRKWNFLVAAALEQVLAFIERTRFTGPELAWLEGAGRFRRRTLDHLANLRVTGEIYPSAPQSALPVASARRRAGPTGGSTVQGAR